VTGGLSGDRSLQMQVRIILVLVRDARGEDHSRSYGGGSTLEGNNGTVVAF